MKQITRMLLPVLMVGLVAGVASAGFEEGVAAFKAKKYSEAAAEFQALVDENEAYDYGWFMLGLSMLQQKKYGEAETNLLKAIELNGDRFDYHQNLALAYFKQRKYSKVIAQLKTAEGLAEGGNKLKLQNMRGTAYFAEKKWSDAINDLEAVAKASPTPQVLKSLGLAYYNLGYYDKALPKLEQASAKAPKDDALLLRVASAHLNQGAESRDKGKKAQHYGKALSFAKKYEGVKPGAESSNLVGRAALGAERFDEAEAAFKKTLAADAKHCYAMTNLGKVYLQKENWTEAEKTLVNATKCSGKLGVAFESLGLALQKQKRYQEAIVAYEKAYEIEPKPAIKGYIDTAKKNIEINAANKAADEEMKRQEEEARKAQEAFEEEQRKLEEYKRQQEDN